MFNTGLYIAFQQRKLSSLKAVQQSGMLGFDALLNWGGQLGNFSRSHILALIAGIAWLEAQ